MYINICGFYLSENFRIYKRSSGSKDKNQKITNTKEFL